MIFDNSNIWLYGYDSDNRLIKAEHKPSSSGSVDLRVEFGYDVLNNRIAKTVDADGDGSGSAVTTKFAYDANGNAYVDFTGTSTIVARHVFGDGTDALVANIVSGSTTWYLQDNLGSTRDLTNSSGTLIDHLDYNSFGKLTYESASGSDRYLYTSREYDAEIDLQYNRARYYDANTGRWISQDPLGFDAGDSNLYRYVNNGPTGATDPSGLIPDIFEGLRRLLPKGPKGTSKALGEVQDEDPVARNKDLVDAWQVPNPQPGQLLRNPRPRRILGSTNPLIAFAFENPLFKELTEISNTLDADVPPYLQFDQKVAQFINKDNAAAWVKIDVEFPPINLVLEHSGFKINLSPTVNAGLDLMKRQVLPRYYLAEKEPGFVKENSNRLQWRKDEKSSKLLEDELPKILGEKLRLKGTFPVENPLASLGIGAKTIPVSFDIKLKIKVELYYATVKK